MREQRIRSLEASLAVWLGRPESSCRIASCRPVSGGCINDAQQVTLDSGEQFFVKWNDSAPDGMFAAEADGLERLHGTGCLRVPRVIDVGSASDGAEYLLLEWIEAGAGAVEESLGRQLAAMHRAPLADDFADGSFGHPLDNYLGSTPQPNSPTVSWVEFWREQRLRPQLQLAASQGRGGEELQQLGERLSMRLDELLGEPRKPPALLHGDLWSGNYYVATDGQPVLVDPACYYGHREAEFGMITLFGGLGPRFYDAYHEAFPLADEWRERAAVYRLHHLLNHLNLFGNSYLADCLATLRRFA